MGIDDLMHLTELDEDELADAGVLESCPMSSPYAGRWDKREDARLIDFGWIGEDAKGIWTTVHPWSAFLSRPDLWAPYYDFIYGHRKITERDRLLRSNFELECLFALIGAHNRASAPKRGRDVEC